MPANELICTAIKNTVIDLVLLTVLLLDIELNIASNKIVANNDLKQQIQLSKCSRFISKTVAIFLLFVLHYTDTVRSSVL